MEYREGVEKVSPQKNFRQHVLTLLSGTVVAQLLPIITLPLLARLFSPEAFGVFATCTAVSTLLAVIATFRYELAIVMAKDHQEASETFSLVLVLSTLGAALGLVGLLALYLTGIAPAGIQVKPIDAVVVVSASWLMGLNQAALLWFNREARYKGMAFAAVFQQVTAAVVRVTIGLGAIALAVNGLFLGTVTGVAVSLGLLLWAISRNQSRPHVILSFRQLLNVALKFRKFPAFNMPYSLLGTFSRDFLLYLLSGFGHVASAGYFGFARSCISIPITFLSTSLGQVYFQRISTRLGAPDIQELTLTIMGKIRVTCLPLFAGLFIWGADVFAVIFGEEWRTAGRYASLFAPATFLFMFSSWPERIFEVSGKQGIALTIQIFSDLITTIVLWFILSHEGEPLVAVAAYSALSSLYHILYVYGLFRAAGFQVSYLFKFLGGCLLGAVVWGAVFYAVRKLLGDHLILAFVASAGLVVGYLWKQRIYLFGMLDTGSQGSVEAQP